jgi:hypothetical protein
MRKIKPRVHLALTRIVEACLHTAGLHAQVELQQEGDSLAVRINGGECSILHFNDPLSRSDSSFGYQSRLRGKNLRELTPCHRERSRSHTAQAR